MATNEDTILSQYVPGFKANLNLVPQQMTGRLIGAVDADLSYGEAGELFNADDIGASDPEDVVGRVAPTPDKFLSFTKRVGSFVPYHDAAWLDNVDKARMLEDPANKTMQALMAGRWRKVDSCIIAAALGTAKERTDQSTYANRSLPAAQVVAVNTQTYVHDDETVPAASADYGMGIGKIIEAGVILDASEIEGEKFLALSAKQMGDLLRSTPVTNQFYNDVRALVSGKVSSLLDFSIIRTERLLKTGSNRRCLAWKKPAIVYRSRPITNARISIRTDMSDTPQAFYKTEHGAVRRYDAGVVEILAKEV